MILREAFRYQNYLSDLRNSLINFLYRDENSVVVTTNRLFSVVDKDKADEKEEVKSEYDINKVIDLINTIITEKKAITEAISTAKKNCEYDIDSLLEVNKFEDSILNLLDSLNKIEGKETKSTDIDYKFNINGEQVSYRYPTKIVRTINFDRNKTKGMSKEMQKDMTDTSNLIDKLNVTVEVDFEPKFDISTNLSDIIEGFKVVK